MGVANFSQKKILLIRFSSFGDVTQCLSVPTRLKELAPHGALHWAVRSDFVELVQGHPFVDHIWSLDRGQGLRGLWQLIQKLRAENYTHIYDAHNNLRSWIICLFLMPPLALGRLFSPPVLLRKSQKRWQRFLLFRFRINRFEQPFSGQRDLLEPLTAWGLSKELPPPPQLTINSEALKSTQQILSFLHNNAFICLAPSAAYPLKRWPLAHWQGLIVQLLLQWPEKKNSYFGRARG